MPATSTTFIPFASLSKLTRMALVDEKCVGEHQRSDGWDRLAEGGRFPKPVRHEKTSFFVRCGSVSAISTGPQPTEIWAPDVLRRTPRPRLTPCFVMASTSGLPAFGHFQILYMTAQTATMAKRPVYFRSSRLIAPRLHRFRRAPARSVRELLKSAVLVRPAKARLALVLIVLGEMVRVNRLHESSTYRCRTRTFCDAIHSGVHAGRVLPKTPCSRYLN